MKRLGSRNARLRSVLSGAATIAIVAVLVTITLRMMDIPDYVLPAPSTIAAALADHRSLLWQELPPTLIEAGLGFALGNIGAVVLAVVIVHFRQPRRVVLSFALFLRSVPIIALTPLLTVWLGLGMAPKVAVVTLMVFFPTLVVTVRGLGSVDRVILDLMHVYDASQLQLLAKVRFPACIPYLFSGLRIAAPTAILGALVAEWLGATHGIGHLMAVATFEFRTDLLWATIVVSALLGIGAFALIALTQRWLVPWSLADDERVY